MRSTSGLSPLVAAALLACGGDPDVPLNDTSQPSDSAIADTAQPSDSAIADTAQPSDNAVGDTVAYDAELPPPDAAPEDVGSGLPLLKVEAGPSDALPLPQATEDQVALGFRVSGRLHPGGRPATWYVEYGPTSSYGSRTPPQALPGKLSAHFSEDWSSGLAGWAGGIGGTSLGHHVEADGAFVRYTDHGGSENDTNHYDGIGVIHLPMYGYMGNVSSGVAEQPSLQLGGGHPDLRGAHLSMSVRGVDWVPRATTLATWIQMDLDASRADQSPMRRANWANTGAAFGALLASGAWERVAWTLDNRPAAWTYAGQYGTRNAYRYKELDASLGDVNVDIFPAQLLYVDIFDLPSGAIDFDDLSMTFRNHSVLAPSNGGHLVASPEGGGDPGALVDGWRFGADHEWTSAPDPDTPQVFLFRFDRPITLTSVLVHNSVAFPSTRVDVLVSADGDRFTSLGERELPTSSPYGPNFLFHHQVLLDPVTTRALPLHERPITHLQVVVLAGSDGAERWGLGELEAFGTGAIEETEDDWYDVNRDVIVPPGTYHHRLVVMTDTGTAYGDDVMIEVPALPPPVIETVVPASGPREGGTYIAIYGDNLALQRSITIGGVVPGPWGIARRIVQVQTLPGRGTCDIVITTEFGTTTLVGGFAYEGDDGLPDPGPCEIFAP